MIYRYTPLARVLNQHTLTTAASSYRPQPEADPVQRRAMPRKHMNKILAIEELNSISNNFIVKQNNHEKAKGAPNVPFLKAKCMLVNT